MSEQESETPVEAPAEEGVDYEAELSRLQQEYDSERPQEDSEDRSHQGEADHPADDTDAARDQIPNLTSGEWASVENAFDRMAGYIAHVENERLIDASLKRIRGNYDLALSDENLQRLARSLVEENENWLNAWRNQESNPIAWKGVENKIGRALHKEFARRELVDVADIEAIEASVRSQVSGNYRKQAPRLTGQETPAEYARWKSEIMGG